jgi:hypothetical protein
LPLRDVDQARDVAPYLVTGLGLADRPLYDLMDQAERPVGAENLCHQAILMNHASGMVVGDLVIPQL